MSDAIIFCAVFGGLLILRILAATLIFAWILPTGECCPNCDAVTLKMENGVWSRLLPWLRKSWCYECQWEGMLRVARSPQTSRAAIANRVIHGGQLPLSSKKSSE
jgi:hypothetical protein